jgi:hypothetical protein
MIVLFWHGQRVSLGVHMKIHRLAHGRAHAGGTAATSSSLTRIGSRLWGNGRCAKLVGAYEVAGANAYLTMKKSSPMLMIIKLTINITGNLPQFEQ